MKPKCLKVVALIVGFGVLIPMTEAKANHTPQSLERPEEVSSFIVAGAIKQSVPKRIKRRTESFQGQASQG